MPSRFTYGGGVLAMLLLLAAAPTGAAPGQNAAHPDAGVAIGGDVTAPFTLTAADLKAMPRTTVTTRDGDRTTTYEGVLLGAVLTRAGVPLGRAPSGNALATYVLVTAADGYQVVYSLGEADPALTDAQLLVADLANGSPLPDSQGPMRIVAPHDTRPARSLRMLRRIDVVRWRR